MPEAIVQPALGERFKALITPHAAERTELLAAGVALHRVNALYPLDFEHLFQQSLAYLLAQGREVMGVGKVSANQWGSELSVAYALRELIVGEERQRYEAQWSEHYRREISNYAQVQQYLSEMGHTYADADRFAGWYGRMLFVCYWLELNPQLSQASSLAQKSLMRFIEGRLLLAW